MTCEAASRERDGPMRLDADPDAAAGRERGSFGDAALSRLDEAAARTSTALRAAARARRVAEMAVQSDRSKVAASLHDSVGATLFAIQAGVRELSRALAGQGELLATSTR